MESDTKKKRGRPRTIAGEMARHYVEAVVTDNGERAAMNYYYAFTFIHDCYGRPENGSFFLSPQGKVRRQGIAEQIGRMLEAELINIDQARELADSCIKDYQDGQSVKKITERLRVLREMLK